MLEKLNKTIKDPGELRVIAEHIAEESLSAQKKSAYVVALVGNLGVGKTTFVQYFAKVMGVEEENITSPSFGVIKRYEIALEKSAKYRNFFHIDAYRIVDQSEIGPLGIREILQNPENIVCIEWPENITGLVYDKRIQLSHVTKNSKTTEQSEQTEQTEQTENWREISVT